MNFTTKYLTDNLQSVSIEVHFKRCHHLPPFFVLVNMSILANDGIFHFWQPFFDVDYPNDRNTFSLTWTILEKG
jgi:hypothetical protein